MDIEYLLDYEAKELEERRKFLKSLDDDFELGKDRFPPDSRFIKLRRPVAEISKGWGEGKRGERTEGEIWTQVPFCGSLIVPIPPVDDKREFERDFFKVSEIPDIVDFVKERGKLQFTLCELPTKYEGLNFLDPVLKELNPPVISGLELKDFVPDHRTIIMADQTFRTLAKGGFVETLERIASGVFSESSRWKAFVVEEQQHAFIFLKGIRHPIINEIQNLMIDDPLQANILLGLAHLFIIDPLLDTRCDLSNFSLGMIQCAHRFLPAQYRPGELRFPCEIGKFLFQKRTLAPINMRSCCDLLDNFYYEDLQSIMEALNTGIVSNNPDIVNKTAGEFSEILDYIYNDTSIRRRIKDLRIGAPLLAAAAGFIAGGPIGAAAAGGGVGLLDQLGFKLTDKAVSTLFDPQITGLPERIAKLRMKSFQINVYDFKKRYAGALLPSAPKDERPR